MSEAPVEQISTSDPEEPYKLMTNPGQFLVDSGLLFEINRSILHQYGLALSVQSCGAEEAAQTVVCQLLDARNDPEGWDFTDDTLEYGEKKLQQFIVDNQDRVSARFAVLGYVTQKIKPRTLVGPKPGQRTE